jgi:signal transduction histidine kinase
MSEKNKTIKKREFLSYPFFTLIVMVIITIGATFLFYQNAVSKDKARFMSEVTERKKFLDYKITTSVALLKATRGFIKTNDQITRKKFKTFINSFDIEHQFQSMQGIGYSKKVISSGGTSIVGSMNVGGISDFRIFPEGERDEFQPIFFLEPQNFKNEKEIGFDMLTDKVRFEAMSLAKKSGNPTASGRTTFYSKNNDSEDSLFYLYLPVYQGENLPVTFENRDNQLDGYVFSFFRLDELLGEIYQTVSDMDVGVIIYDREIKPENILTSSKTGLEDLESKFVETEVLNVADRRWIVQYKSLPVFAVKSDVKWTFIIPSCGLLLTVLLFGLTYTEANLRLKFENTARELKTAEKEKNKLLSSEKKSRRQAERSNRIKDEFLSVISHELRTPLNAIIGWTRIMQGNNVADSTRNRALKTIEKNIRLQSELVDELIDFSKLNSDNISLEKKMINFDSLVDESIEETQPLALKKHIDIVQKSDLSEVQINCESKTIKRALVNLIKNAIKFTPKNGRVELIGERINDKIQLRIKDTGQGIEPDILPHIFDKFKQADSSITRKHGGLGLGLAIARQTVRLHNGDINVESKGKGKGTEFIVELPVDA